MPHIPGHPAANQAGAQTNQAGIQGHSGKRGIKGARDRLWSPEFGGGFLGRQVLDPQVLQQMQQVALGQAPSAAEQLMRAGLDQTQAQAFGLAAGAQGMSPALAMRQAQQVATQAGLQSQAQFGAMRSEEQARAQQAFLQAQLQGQGLNDAAALAREQLLNQLVQTGFMGRDQGFDWQQFAGQAGAGLIGGLATGAGMGLMG